MRIHSQALTQTLPGQATLLSRIVSQTCTVRDSLVGNIMMIS